MTDIRKRRMSPSKRRLSERQTLLSDANRYQRHPAPPIRRPTRSLHISISLLILGIFVLYGRRQIQSKSKKIYAVDGQQLPDWYGVCSKEGKKIYTVPEEGSGVGAVECVVIGGKEVVDAGSLARIRRRWGEAGVFGGVDQSPAHIRQAGGLEILYLPPGHSVTPGLVDSHTHPLEYGHSQQLPLLGCKSIQEVLERVERFVETRYHQMPQGAWIEGLGWDQNLWQIKEFPTAVDFETSPILRGLPIALKRIDVHAEWISPAILERLGTLPDEVDGGQIVRDTSGKPTGVFIDNAIDLLDAVRPPWTFEQMKMYLDLLARDGLSKGLTGVHDAGASPSEIAFFMRIEELGKLPMRFYTMLACPDRETFCGNQIPMIDNAADGKLNLKAVKLFADGALGSRGAALLDDYSDLPGWKGIMRSKEEIWKPLIKSFYDAGWQVNVHAIGDRANHIILNAMESAMSSNLTQGRSRRLRLEHAQILTPSDLKRAADLGIIASYQPTHATSDMSYAEQRLGHNRIVGGAYAWKSYLNAGGRITLGSDFPVESLDPLKGFYAAVTRCWEDGGSPHGDGGWFPEEKLSREEALRGMTVDPAFASFSTITGSLAPGKRFDAVIWDDDLMTVDASEILQVKVRGTLIDGRLVYGRI